MKFSIVTPAYNSEKYIRETIESVIKQKGSFSIEYMVVDNCSTDRTCSIVEEYQELLLSGKIAISCLGVQLNLISEHDTGMYDAIKKGFVHLNGDVFAWINSDDIYLPGAFEVIQQTLVAHAEIKWIKGITSYINESSTIYAVGQCNLYRQEWIREGVYGTALPFIQQDSVFWRADLWKISSGVNNKLSLAGDYFLWRSFAEYSQLYSIKAYVSCFRKVVGQKSMDINAYRREIEEETVLDRQLLKSIERKLRRLDYLLPFLRPLGYNLIFGQHQYNLVTLDDGRVPHLRLGNYYTLREFI